LNDANAQKEKINTATIDVELKPSPNTVNVGDVLNLGIVLENHGTKTNVTSIELLYPDWDTSFNDKLPLNLGTNQSKFLSLTTKVPYDLSAGTYQLVVSIKATGSEYFGESSVDVRRFQAFDLSGELPVSIIGIVITGITAYFIVTYLRSRKFEPKLAEMILAGIVFGIVSWFLTGKSIDQVANSDIYDYLKAFGVAISLAFLFSFLYVLLLRGLSRIADRLDKSKVIDEWRKPRTTWDSLFRNITYIRESVGFGYTFHIKLNLKEAAPAASQYEGLLWKYDEKSHDIVIHPRYVGKCYSHRKQEIVHSLTSSVHFTRALSKDKKYRRKLLNYVNAPDNITDSIFILKVQSKLMDTDNTEVFSNELQEIDFSRFVRYVFEDLNLSPSIQYDNITFIPGWNISSIEIVSYETRYAIQLYPDDSSTDFEVIPKTYAILGQHVLR